MSQGTMERPAEPRISVIVATINSERFVSEALASVEAQTLPPHEVILVDGGSTDSTLDIAASFKGVTIAAQRSLGLAQAWNEGIEGASGSHIAWLDSDDVWDPLALASHAGELHRSPEVGATVGRVRFFLEAGQPSAGFRKELLVGDHLAYMPGTSLVRRDVVDEVGRFRRDLGASTDIAWWAELRRVTSIATLPCVVLNKRVHGDNYSLAVSRDDSYARTVLGAIRAYRDRQGSGQP